jgi:hypothetical protein
LFNTQYVDISKDSRRLRILAVPASRFAILLSTLLVTSCGDGGSTPLDAGGQDVVHDATPGPDVVRDATPDLAEDAGVVDAGPITLAPGVVSGSLIALDDSTVYFTSTGPDPLGSNGKVQKVAKSGGTVTDLATGLGVPYGIAVNGTDVYFCDRFVDTVYKVPRGGGPMTPFATGQPHANRVALDAANAYWTNSGPSENQDGSVMKMPLGGTTPFALATGLDLPEAIALDDTYVYWTNTLYLGGSVMRTRIDGTQTTPTTLAMNQFYALGIALDATYVYWTTQFAVMKVAKTNDGTAPPIIVAPHQNFPKEVAVDLLNVYWTNADAVEELPLSGRGLQRTLAHPTWGVGVAVDALWVYYVDGATLTHPGAILRVGK